jgi:alpha-mannosidase
MTQRRPLYYTFGNHMHWVDMEWLWGYTVLPDSARDMLRYCAESGARGNINFDGIGYEKMASEAPEALAEVRDAIARGQIEVVGASYGQPYGLFHGGESNVRQRVYGARTVRRVLGVWPRTFWEEEFDFFPQLPQLLRGVGYEYASLFFQWTWHTPEVPRENLPAVWWEGLDGSRLLTATRNALNLHQWPEDFAGLLESEVPRRMPAAGIMQWLELMPSKDWMCRAELMLPPLKALMAHPDFELRLVTLPEYLEAAREHAVPRRYTLDDVFHGVSLGKNGDLFRRLSRRAERDVLAAESLSALVGLFGRPYPSWDVYPAWELDEAWRELLSAQHHDNDECEALCGHVGRRSYERSQSLSRHISERTLRLLAERTSGPAGRMLVYNPLGWSRTAVVSFPGVRQPFRLDAIPPFGYRVFDPAEAAPVPQAVLEETERHVSLRRGAFQVTVDRQRGVITQIYSAEFPEGALRPDVPLGDVMMTRQGQPERFERVKVRAGADRPAIEVSRMTPDNAVVTLAISLAAELDAVDIRYGGYLSRPDPGMHTALQTRLAVNLPDSHLRLIHDHPFGLSEVRAQGVYRRKYPTGDWMTSPQVFEEIRQPFTALQLLDLDDGQRGLLYLHNGSQAMFREGETGMVRNILSMYDAWDERYYVRDLDAAVRLVPHGSLTHAERWKLAQEFIRPVLTMQSQQPSGPLPATFGGAWCSAPNVVISAFYREAESVGAYLEHYPGKGLGYPYLLRLVELDGQATTARLCLPGPVASAYRTNLLGAPLETLQVTPAELPLESAVPWNAVELSLRPHEIATLYLDLELGRKQSRDLDAYRHVWATVHRVGEVKQ